MAEKRKGRRKAKEANGFDASDQEEEEEGGDGAGDPSDDPFFADAFSDDEVVG